MHEQIVDFLFSLYHRPLQAAHTLNRSVPTAFLKLASGLNDVMLRSRLLTKVLLLVLASWFLFCPAVCSRAHYSGLSLAAKSLSKSVRPEACLCPASPPPPLLRRQ